MNINIETSSPSTCATRVEFIGEMVNFLIIRLPICANIFYDVPCFNIACFYFTNLNLKHDSDSLKPHYPGPFEYKPMKETL